MRKLGAALLALPVVLMVYLTSFGRRGTRTRIAAGLAASAVIGLVVVASLPPAPSVAVPKSQPPPVSAELLDAVRTGHALKEPFTDRLRRADGARIRRRRGPDRARRRR